MKRLLMILLLGSICSSYASEPMFTPDTEWHYRHSEMFGGPSDQYTYTLIVKDTMLNGVPYQVIGGGVLRSEGAKVWCVVDSMGVSVENLLYDFDLQVGDSIRTIYDGMYEEHPCFAKVTNVDTITLSDGRKARRISYNTREDDIEYIGNISGIFGAIVFEQPLNGVSNNFICCTRGNNLLYEKNNGDCERWYNDDAVNALHNVSEWPFSFTKIFHDGQILILRGDKTYTLQGQIIR